jgi:uncharacterized iron-regulated protein
MKISTSVFSALLSLVMVGLAGSVQAGGASPLASCLAGGSEVCAIYDTGSRSGRADLAAINNLSELAKHVAGMKPADILILGEAHDNPHHHTLRAGLLSAPAIVMEQLRADQESGVAAFNEFNAVPDRAATLEDLKSKVGWAKGGWDKYPYDPLLAALVATRAQIYAGDPPRNVIRKAAKEGNSALPEADRMRLALDVPLGPELDAASADEIEASHCGMLPKTAIPGMAFAQRYRDAHLADATLQAATRHGQAILLTGNNHARTDRGVPWYLRARAPEKTVVSVVFVEVEDGKWDPEGYVPRGPDGKAAADFLVFTPTIARDDPCKAFGK